MGLRSRNETIVHKQEQLALTMLERASKPEVSVDVQLDVFDKISRWVAVKNKLENDDGGGIAEYKRQLFEGASDTPARRSRARKDAATGGARLEAIKSRLPGADDGGADGDSEPASGAVPVAVGGKRRIHIVANDGGES